MAKKYFGTDGIRGTANSFPMTPEIALKVGMVVGKKFTLGKHRHRVVIGKDTRLSGYVIEPALTSGFAAAGMDVFLVGPVPTPAVSMLTRSLRADLGVMISASHNPYHDNGIKIFDRAGRKLDDAIEKEIEEMIDGDKLDQCLAQPDQLGRVKRLENARGRYVEFVKNSFPKEQTLNGLKVAIDAANGAAYKMAPLILWELGAQVVSIGVEPDGFNINQDCGSTKPQALCKAVVENKSDIGIALDGDADRLLIVDEKGEVVAGDKVIGLIAKHLHSKKQLKNNSVVATQMSNLALEKYIEDELGLNFVRTAVGDRYVLEAMAKGGYNFGGEQSGHLVLSDYSTTGDGLIAALQILSIICEEKKPVSQLANIFALKPQILKNVTYKKGGKNPLEDAAMQKFIKDQQEQLGDRGRIFVRKSGTENLIRIMVEGDDEASINAIADAIAEKLPK
ncbi:MAG: phosphoglucosamine mutase [Proteobacteria bacterium]|nr:phosphoglucosamine mutase [Pseudomonadota bacterium]